MRAYLQSREPFHSSLRGTSVVHTEIFPSVMWRLIEPIRVSTRICGRGSAPSRLFAVVYDFPKIRENANKVRKKCEQNQMEQKFPRGNFESLGVPREVVRFNFQNLEKFKRECLEPIKTRPFSSTQLGSRLKFER